jgi:cytochrome b561
MAGAALLKNTETEYGTVTKTFHWGIALLVICLLAVGLVMGELPKTPSTFQIYNLHKSLGITVLALMIGRICWHIVNHRPHAVETLKPWEKISAAGVHYSLYVLLVAMPITGWLMSSAAGRAVNVFGLFTLPDLVAKDESAAHTYRERHEQIGYLIMIVLALHIAAALKHYFIDKDRVLKRMLPILATLLVCLPAPANATAREWTMDHARSSITFRPQQLGKEFKGTFDLFSAAINFDPKDLTGSKVVVDIHITSAHTGAPDRDETLTGKDWFDAAQFPEARFEAKTFRKTGEGAFEADGTLRIKDITVPLTLPFTLSFSERGEIQEATMDGTITLDRSVFKLGTGQWADTGIIANKVPVDIHLTAGAQK